MSLPRLCVNDNQRFLMTEAGAPFFWLGDTAWELFHRLTREEAAFYFAARQQQRFNLIQAVILAEFDGLDTPNVYGDHALHENDPTRPNEAYFRYVDELITLAAHHDLYVGLLPTWGDKVNERQWGVGPTVFNEQNAYTYGEFLGNRYKEVTNIVWILGGDRPPIFEKDGLTDDYRSLWRAMAAGIDAGTGATIDSRALKTYHPAGRTSTSQWLHEEPWLDFNMMQSGLGGGPDFPVWEMIERDYARTPTKPTLDGEPNYEDHPINPRANWDPANGHYRDHDVRKQIYRSVFAGGCGVTYGHHSVWQFCGPRNPGFNHTDLTWLEALARSAANQVQYLRALLESRPFFSRVPDQSLIGSDLGSPNSQIRRDHMCATRDINGSYALIYLPRTRPVQIDLTKLSGVQIRGWWYCPRSGQLSHIGLFGKSDAVTFTPPSNDFDTVPSNGSDWVLVLDDSSQPHLPPGVLE